MEIVFFNRNTNEEDFHETEKAYKVVYWRLFRYKQKRPAPTVRTELTEQDSANSGDLFSQSIVMLATRYNRTKNKTPIVNQ